MFVLFASLSMSAFASCILGIVVSIFTKAKKKPLAIGLGASIGLFFVAVILSQFADEMAGLDVFLMLAGFAAPPIAVVYYLLFSYRKMNPEKEATRIEQKIEYEKVKQRVKELKQAKKITKDLVVPSRREEAREKSSSGVLLGILLIIIAFFMLFGFTIKIEGVLYILPLT